MHRLRTSTDLIIKGRIRFSSIVPVLIGAALLSACGSDGGGQSTNPGADPEATHASQSAAKEAFSANGFISDSTCGADHAGMLKTGSMGSNDESCVLECVKAGSKFVFVSDADKKIFRLSDQDSARKFAGQKVKIDGKISADKAELSDFQLEAIK